MHLHSLTLQGIGPFPGRHTIDFAELAASGIFLLEGPTGAGKSTVIDAIVFALYGKVASEAASEDRLRSAYAEPEVESFVDLVFSTGTGVFRVRRSPEYQRPKKRGTGTTTQQAGVRLWRLTSVPDDVTDDALDGVGELLTNRLDEAGAEIQRFVGLDRRQFVQTVVLPQGEFASFLRADPEKRRDLLQKVFGTEVYEKVQERLGEMQRAATRETARARAEVDTRVGSFVTAAGLDAEDAQALTSTAADAVRSGEVVGEAETHVEDLRSTSVGADEAERTATTVLDVARGRWDSERATAEAIATRAALRARTVELDARTDGVAGERERLAASGRAAVVMPVLAGEERTRTALAAAIERHGLALVGMPPRLVDAQDSDLLATAAELAGAATRLRLLLPVGERLPRDESRLATDRKEVERLALDRADLLAQVAERPAARARLVTARDALATVAGLLGAREQAESTAQQVHAAALDAASATTALATATTTHREAAAQATAAVDHEHVLRRARHAGIAGELAAALVPAEPCLVCGGTEHPAPAALDADHVTAAAVDVAEAARKDAEAAVAAAGTEVARLDERLAGAIGRSGGATVPAAQDALDAARAAVTQARTAHDEHEAATAGIAAFDTLTTDLTADAAALAEQVAAATSAVDALAVQVARDRDEIAAGIEVAAPLLADADLPDTADPTHPEGSDGIHNPVDIYADALQRRAQAVDALLAARAAVTTAERALAERSDEVAAVLAETGFADVAAARSAALDDAARSALDASVRTHDDARAAVVAGLADPRVAALAEDATADVDAARAVVDEAEAVASATAKDAALAQRRLADAVAAAEQLAAAVLAGERAREDAAPVLRMAGLASGQSGDNARSLSLATFVLVRRFEEVVDAANARLTEMSDGRYELLRSDEKEDVRSRRTGLAMKVVDHWTEQSRDPRTLSGGETFYVSLCLALGMADVVTAEAGGVDLGTLFVDEGFGTLDPEALEAVLAELGKLRAGGRVVGVVSHVDALKQAVAERIEVRRLPGGASTLRVRA